MLDMLEIEPRGSARSTVIWLHGLGADGHDFEPLVRDWGLADELGTRFLLPHAPHQPVTLNGGMVMRAWYDIRDLGFESGEDREGIERARQYLLGLVEREQQRGIDTSRVVLAGFSQGGALCLHTALRYPRPLAGVLGLSCYLPLAPSLPAEKRAESDLVIRMDHGDQDNVVPFAVAQRSCNTITSQGYKVEFNRYPMGHSLCPQQMDSLRDWFRAMLGSAGTQSG